MKKPILVVMAAGIGSRYGGLKQTDPIGQYGELIIDYSVYDAIKVGFKKVIFIINKSIETEFKEIVGNRLMDFIEVDYAFQELNDVPKEIELPAERIKPLGTAHAIYSARHLIDAPFAVINADDFYGNEAFAKIYDFLSQSSLSDYHYTMVGYQLINTVTENGYVSRGVCTVNEDSVLTNIIERTHIEKKGNTIEYFEHNKWFPLSSKEVVSMNMWGFSTSILEAIETTLVDYLEEALKKDPLKCEYFLPYVVDQMIKEEKCKVQVLETKEKWYGVTYSSDKAIVVEAIAKMIELGKYPIKLWEAMQC